MYDGNAIGIIHLVLNDTLYIKNGLRDRTEMISSGNMTSMSSWSIIKYFNAYTFFINQFDTDEWHKNEVLWDLAQKNTHEIYCCLHSKIKETHTQSC